MNKNNKVGNYFEVDGISHCLNPAIVSEALRLSLVVPSSTHVERSSGLDVSGADEHVIDIVDVDEVHLSLFGPGGEHKSISENSLIMNKNNKAATIYVGPKVYINNSNNREVSKIGFGKTTAEPHPLFDSIVQSSLIDNEYPEEDIHVANQIYSDYLDSQGRLHRVSLPE